MAIGNFAFRAASSQARNLVLELPGEGCELCKSDADGAALCGSCADIMRTL